MAQNTENIEARLCDYIEGELDEQGRAEIEKHIEQNPQHQQLLQELMQTRDYVRDLPRATAPAEILESLQGQLERSGLLEPAEGDDESELVLRVRRLPQFAAIAAMLVLAVGLAAVIYFVLPQNANGPEFAVAPPIPNGSGDTIEIDAHHDSVATVDADAEVLHTEPIEVAGAEPEASLKTDVATDVFTLAQNMGVTLPEALAGFDRAGGIFGANEDVADAVYRPARHNRLFVIVTTPDTVAANSDVNEYLVSNQMQWQTEPEAMPEPLELERMQRVLASKQRQSNVAVLRTESNERASEISSAVPSSAPAASGAMASVDAKESTRSKAAISGQVSTAASTPRLQKSEGWPGAMAMPQGNDGVARLDDPRIAVPTAEEFALQVRQSKQRDHNRDESEPVIIVRKMTKRQAADLSNTLSNRRAGQRAEVMDEAAFTVDPEFRNLTPTGRPDDFGLAGAPATRPARQIQGVEVQATTPSDPKDAPATTQPTTRELSGRELAEFVDPLPSTQPAAAEPVAEEELSVDVVIVLQNPMPVAEESVPSTQPAPADALHLESLMP